MIAIVAGQGDLPRHIIKSLQAQNLPFQLCQMHGFPVSLDHPVLEFRIEQLGSFLQELKARDVTKVVFAGSVHRPKIDPTAINAQTIPLVPRMMQAIQQGDDAALRVVLDIFQDAGFSICAAVDIAPNLMPDAGNYTDVFPSDIHKKDTSRAVKLLDTIAPLDIGQACVVGSGQVIAVEGIMGTDWMLLSLNPDLIEQSAARPKGGVFYKAPKFDQDRRIDMPTIGVSTVDSVEAAGLDGIVIEARGVQVLDFDKVVARANEKGLFLWVRERSL
ncbi:LpxI family protein [Parasulfitobacter algicola]|uniref:UDP-2,3-diacylglucosamine diphosphatase LpxI n=1 Tax=Parasulfitobacter algicola TaxID=2614809 RepID=A0ABX2IR53_9RHOB|nr:UDP-2,3-diacylglucosamine diphosphatase LpxI [Sulfitobacter algicola]NSX55381.1 UDP-2,3-diacylglucosamine diphosphatase LpxI [Sulfitobacter algicola]